jgi:hypothetical protein
MTPELFWLTLPLILTGLLWAPLALVLHDRLPQQMDRSCLCGLFLGAGPALGRLHHGPESVPHDCFYDRVSSADCAGACHI